MAMLRMLAIPLLLLVPAAAQESRRPRLAKEEPPGRREKLSLGILYLPEGLPAAGKVPLFLHFHGPGWIAEVAARHNRLAVIHAQLGTGSAVYGKPFGDAENLRGLLREAQKVSGRDLELVGLTGWSAGYGAVRAILRAEEHYARVHWVVLLDGLHAGYRAGKDREPLAADLDCFVRLAKDAAAGRGKRFLVTHTRIAPGRYASTTETADYLLAEVGVKRHKPGGGERAGLPVESEARRQGLRVLGCAGESAADHVDHLHALPALLRETVAGKGD